MRRFPGIAHAVMSLIRKERILRSHVKVIEVAGGIRSSLQREEGEEGARIVAETQVVLHHHSVQVEVPLFCRVILPEGEPHPILGPAVRTERHHEAGGDPSTAARTVAVKGMDFAGRPDLDEGGPRRFRVDQGRYVKLRIRHRARIKIHKDDVLANELGEGLFDGGGRNIGREHQRLGAREGQGRGDRGAALRDLPEILAVQAAHGVPARRLEIRQIGHHHLALKGGQTAQEACQGCPQHTKSAG